MPLLKQNLALQPVKFSPGWLLHFVTEIQHGWERLAQILNGRISFGDGTNEDNVDGAWISVTSPAVVDTDFTVAHNLNRVPVGYIIMTRDKAGVVYTGSVVATITELTLRCNVATVALTIFVI